MRLGEGVLLGIWLLIGAASSAWLESRLSRERDLDWADYAILFGYAVSGPFALLAVAGYLATRPPKVHQGHQEGSGRPWEGGG